MPHHNLTLSPYNWVFCLCLMVTDTPSPLLDYSLHLIQDNGETTSRVWILHCREHSKWCTYGSFLYFKACMQECQMAEPVNVICINCRDFLLKKSGEYLKKCHFKWVSSEALEQHYLFSLTFSTSFSPSSISRKLHLFALRANFLNSNILPQTAEWKSPIVHISAFEICLSGLALLP